VELDAECRDVPLGARSTHTYQIVHDELVESRAELVELAGPFVDRSPTDERFQRGTDGHRPHGRAITSCLQLALDKAARLSDLDRTEMIDLVENHEHAAAVLDARLDHCSFLLRQRFVGRQHDDRSVGVEQRGALRRC
jgi:hypothetical protein